MIIQCKNKIEEEDLELIEGTNVYKHLERAFDYIEDNRRKFAKEIVDSTLQIMLNEDTNCDGDKINEFANHIMEQIGNMSIRMSTNKRNQCYSPQLLDIANAI